MLSCRPRVRPRTPRSHESVLAETIHTPCPLATLLSRTCNDQLSQAPGQTWHPTNFRERTAGPYTQDRLTGVPQAVKACDTTVTLLSVSFAGREYVRISTVNRMHEMWADPLVEDPVPLSLCSCVPAHSEMTWKPRSRIMERAEGEMPTKVPAQAEPDNGDSASQPHFTSAGAIQLIFPIISRSQICFCTSSADATGAIWTPAVVEDPKFLRAPFKARFANCVPRLTSSSPPTDETAASSRTLNRRDRTHS